MTTNETNGTADAMKQRRENILDLLDIMDEGNLTALRFKDGQMEIELERKPAAGALSASTLPLMAERVGQLLNAREDATGVVAGAASAPVAGEDDASVVRSPMVGTFYTSPAPGEPPFVQVGDEVAANQTLCIVEAMKLMNEITAEEMGTVREVCLEDASPVEFGTPLFYVEPHGAPAPAPETA